MTKIFFNFWRKVGFALALATILFCYTTLPDSVAITHAETGEPEGFISKEVFFYASAGILLLFNLLVNALRDQLAKVNFAKVNPVSEWAKQPKKLSAFLINWFNGFLAFVNTFLVFVLLGLYNVNTTRGQRLDLNYNWLMLFGAAMLLFILFYLPLKLLYTNPSANDE
ncbi:MAG: hypothetical protein NWQ46_03075 [Spirosomaceae bacterium]|nr:hypothetical protein [Spirosomataceae bacterium]